MKKLILSLVFFSFSLNAPAQKGPSEEISKDFLLGKLNYRQEIDFLKIDNEHTSRALYLNKETYSAFVKMFRAAKADGIELKIISGARNFEHQKAIWERKWRNNKDLDPLSRSRKILEFSSMPATSRHHWGTEIDLNNLENSYFEEGKGKAEYEWLVKNAPRFGFFQVYTSKDSGRTGYSEEKWHWSYLPLARHYLQAYNEIIQYSDITGFEGAHLAEAQEMIAAYVNGISVEDFSGKPETRTVFTLSEE